MELLQSCTKPSTCVPSFFANKDMYFIGVPRIELVDLEIDTPYCPSCGVDLLDPLPASRYQNLKLKFNVLLLDGNDATCTPPFDGGRRLLQLQFVVTVPTARTKYFILRLVVKQLHCHLPSIVVMVNHPNNYTSGVHFVECASIESLGDSSTNPRVCSYACPLHGICREGDKTGLTLRLERVNFHEKYARSGMCTIALEYIKG